MKIAALSLIALASSASAFAPASVSQKSVAVKSSLTESFELGSIESELKYKPGKADTAFAKKYGHLVGAKVRTVGEAFADFTKEFGLTVNALYKNMVTDIVGSTHLILVNARFKKDAVWSLGLLTSLDLLLKNYPEPGVGAQLISSFFKSMGLDEAEVRAEAQTVLDWASGKTKEEIEAALSSGDASTPLGAVAADIKGDEFWMYSRYFGLGLVRIMDTVGVEMDKDEVYPIMENWMSTQLGRSHNTACSDSDLYFRVRDKLDMMETLMKEIEIREKKRMAERLEEKAEQALRAAEREDKMKVEIEKEAEENRERVSTD
jgi:hypothetical protein